MLEVNAGVKTELDVIVKPRLNILYMVVYELADQFGASSSCLEIITKGILEKQYIRKVILRYHNRENKIVGEVYFTIDWEKYEINAVDNKGAEFKINCKKSTYSQISEMSEEIVRYVNKMRQDLDIVKIESLYNTIDCKTEDKKDIDEYLGLEIAKERPDYDISPEFQHNFEFLFGLLGELIIGVRRVWSMETTLIKKK